MLVPYTYVSLAPVVSYSSSSPSFSFSPIQVAATALRNRFSAWNVELYHFNSCPSMKY